MSVIEKPTMHHRKLLDMFLSTHSQALQKNEETTAQWIKYKEQYLTLRSQLISIPDKLSHKVMVPIGSKALMRGSIVHTNEILVNLGDGWFVKQSAKVATEVCDRRIQMCTDMILNLEREQTLLNNRKHLPVNEEAFGNDIVEPYDEKKESEWRVQHRQKEKDYRQHLSKLRKQETENNDKKDDEFWRKLEQLELQEELEEELERFHKDHPEIKEEPAITEEQRHPSTTKENCRVSFQESSEDKDYESDSSSETLCIEFTHSSNRNSQEPSGGTLTSPSDIYKLFPKPPLKSILKTKSKLAVNPGLEIKANNTNVATEDPRLEIQSRKDEVRLPVAFGNVCERQVVAPVEQKEISAEQARPASRFRAARQNTLASKK